MYQNAFVGWGAYSVPPESRPLAGRGRAKGRDGRERETRDWSPIL